MLANMHSPLFVTIYISKEQNLAEYHTYLIFYHENEYKSRDSVKLVVNFYRFFSYSEAAK